MVVHDLLLQECDTPEGVAFDMTHFREQLRAEREARIGGRDRLAGKVGLAKSTIQNAEMGPDIPGIDTVARLIEGMPGLTLSSFFAKLETHDIGHESGRPSTGGPPRDRPLQTAAPEAAALQEELGSALARYVHAIAREQAPTARPTRSSRRKSHRKNR